MLKSLIQRIQGGIRLTSPIPIELSARRFKVTPIVHDGYALPLTGNLYKIESLNEDGTSNAVTKVKSFKFEIASPQSPGIITMEFYD